MNKIFLFTTLFACSISAFAKLSTPTLFSDNMLLRENSQNRIWGTADANAKVEILFNGSKVSTIADNNGRWSLFVTAPDGSNKARNLQIFENGNLAKTIKNVLVGEIWVTGGQSNMHFSLNGIIGKDAYVKSASAANVRVFTMSYPVDKMTSLQGYGKYPNTDCDEGLWQIPSPKNSNSFHGIAYVFAVERAKARKGKPVGVVLTAVPGTSMMAWVSRDMYEKSAFFKSARDDFSSKFKNYNYKKSLANYEEAVRTFDERVAKAKASGKTPPAKWTVRKNMRPWSDSPFKWSSPVLLFNIQIAPLAKYSATGVVWYQGENGNSEAFAERFEGLVSDWRRHFDYPEMPFLFVQLPSYSSKLFVEKRRAQEEVANKLKNVHMICAIDTGDKNDIHPHDKVDIAKRLAQKAGALDKNISPKLKKCSLSGSSATVFFKTKAPLVFKGEPRGFEAYVNDKWVPADATLVNGSVRITAKENGEISAVRYLWKPWAKPDTCLFDKHNNPVPPFNTNYKLK